MVQVGCAGILVADTFAGPLKALPGEGQLITLDSMLTTIGGCAANVACDLTKQAISVGVAGCVGDDPSAEIVRGELEARGVDCQQVKTMGECPTSQTVVIVVEGQDRRFIHVFGANGMFSVDHLDRQWLSGLTALYLGGLFAMPSFRLLEFAELLKYCREHEVLTVVDVVVSEEMEQFDGLDACLPHIDLFLPNTDEAAKLTRRDEPLEQAKYFRDKGVATTVITLGEKGSLAVRGNDCWRAPVFYVNVVDGTGCGDAFAAGLMTAVLRGLDLPESLAYASALGGSCSQALGCYDGVFTAQQVESFLTSHEFEIKQVAL